MRVLLILALSLAIAVAGRLPRGKHGRHLRMGVNPILLPKPAAAEVDIYDNSPVRRYSIGDFAKYDIDDSAKSYEPKYKEKETLIFKKPTLLHVRLDKYGDEYGNKYDDDNKYDDKYIKYDDKYIKYDDKYIRYDDKNNKYIRYDDKYIKYDDEYNKYDDKYNKYDDKNNKYDDKYIKYDDKYIKYDDKYIKYDDKNNKYADKYNEYSKLFNKDGMIYLTLPELDEDRKLNKLMNNVVAYREDKNGYLRRPLAKMFDEEELSRLKKIAKALRGEDGPTTPKLVYEFAELVNK